MSRRGALPDAGLELSVDVAKHVAKRVTQSHYEGIVTVADVYEASAKRLKCEIVVLRAKRKLTRKQHVQRNRHTLRGRPESR